VVARFARGHAEVLRPLLESLWRERHASWGQFDQWSDPDQRVILATHHGLWRCSIMPFFAFLPDNYLLRAENLVPIHFVSTLDEERSFINIQSPTWKEWEWFLRDFDFEPTPMGKGRHAVWRRRGFRPLTIN
jgi:hypothetical protein